MKALRNVDVKLNSRTASILGMECSWKLQEIKISLLGSATSWLGAWS